MGKLIDLGNRKPVPRRKETDPPKKAIVGIDPGVNHTGVAVFVEGSLGAAWLINRESDSLADNIRDQKEELQVLMHNISDQVEFEKVVVELPRIYPGSKARDNDQMDLSVVAGALLTAALLMVNSNIVPILVTPHDWKGTTPKNIHNRRVLKKVPEIADVLKQFPKGKHEHMIDAAGLGLWAMGKGV
jgi:hypothetical protein